MVKSARASQASIDYELLSHIAHEARGPFNGLLGFSDLLDTSFDSISADKQKEYIHLVKLLASKSFFQLQTLIAWIKLVSDNFTPNHSTVSISESINASVQYLANDLKSRAIQPSIHPHPTMSVEGDPNYLNLALANILAAILPHIEKGSPLEIVSNKEESGKTIIYKFHTNYKREELLALFPSETESGTQISELQTPAWVATQLLSFHKAHIIVNHIENDLFCLQIRFPLNV